MGNRSRASWASSTMRQAPPVARDALLGAGGGISRPFTLGNASDPSASADRDGSPGRLIVVSNRVPTPEKPGSSTAGGLAVALDAALKKQGGIWLGWSGEARPALDADAVRIHKAGPVTFAFTDLTKRDVDDYYLGFANRTLWPICHYRLDLARFEPAHIAAFFRVNGLFARKIARFAEAGDRIWVHDYHFLSLGAALRDLGLRNRLGFFLHIPWPAPEVAAALPAYRRLLRDMTAYDLIGFQTDRDARNFADCLLQEKVAEARPDGRFEAGGHVFSVRAFPIGIDTEGFRRTAQAAERNPLVRRMRASLEGKQLIIGVDRLDYSKGILERIAAFSSFIRDHQEARGRVSYLQVTPKSRSEVPEYKAMQREVAAEVGEANGAIGDVDWTPIRYLNQNIAHASLAGLYRMARAALVTPLRDGMNLVAKEFVAAQAEEDPGVLILSRFAGAAQELEEALIVNPYDAKETGEAIAEALAMPLSQRRERWNALIRRLEANTVSHWCEGFLDALEAATGDLSQQRGSSEPAMRSA
jgi:trehalose 6-phosphate synthase